VSCRFPFGPVVVVSPVGNGRVIYFPGQIHSTMDPGSARISDDGQPGEAELERLVTVER